MTAAADPTETFIARWDGTAMAERANYAPFLCELCDIYNTELSAALDAMALRFSDDLSHPGVNRPTEPLSVSADEWFG